jgi:hypothetical protein
LRDLDQRIADGRGAETIAALDDEYRTRYLALREAPAPAATSPAAFSPAAPEDRPGTVPSPRPAQPLAPVGPAFSWSAFIADQAIAIMAYLGGFLLLMATLSFEVGLADFGDQAKLAIVVVVYAIFGGLGFGLRQVDRLRTVGGAYLGVFALMTPLVALAVYLFALRGLGISVPGMLCIASAYATVIYLILAQQTRFATYGYLGWVALVVASEAGVAWSRAPGEWWVFALLATAVVLHAPARFRGQDALTESAMIVGALATVVGLVAAEVLNFALWFAPFNPQMTAYDHAAVTLADSVLVPLLALWSLRLRANLAPTNTGRRDFIDLVEWLCAGGVAQIAVSGAFWAKADAPTLAYLLATLGMGEFGLSLAARRWRADRPGFRISLEALGLSLAVIGTLVVGGRADPNWAVITALLAAGVIALGITLAERLPWWLLASGFFFSLAYRSTVLGFLASNAGPQPDLTRGILIFTLAELGLVALLWMGGLGLGLGILRRYATPLYVVALGNAVYVATVASLNQDRLGSPFVVGLLLALAALAGIAALREAQAWAMLFGAGFGLWAISQVAGSGPTLILLLTLIAVGAALRQFRGRGWNIPWLVAAILATPYAIARLDDMGMAAPHWRVGVLLLLAAIAYLVAVQERAVWVTSFATAYGLVAVAFVQVAPNFVPTLIITFAAALVGAVIRLRVNVRWALALYGLAAGTSLFDISRLTPLDGSHLEALLLVFGGVAYVLAALEANPWASVVPLLYATGAILTNPDPHALLPLALIFAALGIVAGRVGGARWLLPPYLAATVAAGATAFQAQQDPAFEALSLAIMALVTYLIASIEARPEVLLPALVLSALALASGANWYQLPIWQTALLFVGLAWLTSAGAYLWRVLPWIGTATRPWWAANRAEDARWRDLRFVGMWVHRWAGLLLGLVAVLVATLPSDGFASHSPTTQAAVGTLLALALMILLRGFDRESIIPNATSPRILWYLAGEFAALAVTWEARWLGAENIQAFVLAPGSYQVLIGALLPVDERVGRPIGLGRAASVLGALLLLLPTLAQSFQNDQSWGYALALAVEAIVIVGVGLGTRARVLVLTGSSFVGLAAIRGVILAFQSGAIAVIIGALAVLLMGGATWLSLRQRRETPPPNPLPSGG